jgi:hypothetical protein
MREGVEGDPLFLNKQANPGGRKIDLVACTAKKKAERIDLALAENKLQRRFVLDCKCAAYPCEGNQKRLRTVDITHLEAVDERPASLEIVLINACVHVPVD